MEVEKDIQNIEIFRTFYISEVLLKGLSERMTLNEKVFEDKLLDLIRKAKKITDKTLIEYVAFFCPKPDALRYDNYMNTKWKLKEIPLMNCGAWPAVGELPYEVTYGNILDTAAYVDRYLKNKNLLTWKTSKILYMERMLPYIKVLSTHLPIIVLEGNVIRNNKLWEEDVLKKSKLCKYDIDDGNHRAIALALTGAKTIKAYVGKRIYKNDLIY